jgi:tubulin monoglycylase TTLL3/8
MLYFGDLGQLLKKRFRLLLLITEAYWFQQGYLRTSSNIFNLDDLDSNQTHLTNDAIQNRFSEYGKYEKGNKVSFEAFN